MLQCQAHTKQSSDATNQVRRLNDKETRTIELGKPNPM